MDIRKLRQDHSFSNRLNYANKSIREIRMNVMNTTYITTEDVINKLQSVRGKAKLKFYKNLSNYYDEMIFENFNFEDIFSENAQSINEIYHEVLLLMELLQTKPKVKSMNIKYYNLYYTAIKNRDDKESVKNKYEDNENDYINYEDFITPNQYV